MSPAQLHASSPRVTDLIGRTPLVALTRLLPQAGVQLLAKLEGQNPGGSVKDRTAWGIVEDALARGVLRPGGRLLDATSGNTGIAYAMLGAALGFRVQLCVPASAGEARLRLLRLYGADLVITDPMEGSDGAIREARARAARSEEGVFYADQYSNPANWRAHYQTTGVEILEQTAGEITHFIAGLGTTGTLVGVGRRLREHKPDVRLVAAQPDSPLHAIEGWKHLPTALVPAIYDPTLADEHAIVSTEEAMFMVQRLAREEGLFVSPSAGAACAVACRVAERLREGTVVVLFADGGEKHLHDRSSAEGA